MPESVRAQIDKLRASIAGLEAQRALLGDAIVEPALAALRQQLASLERSSTPDAAASAPTLDGERRLVTILFTDIVGSTSLAEKLDPEEWKEIVSEAHRIVGEAVNRYQGTIAQLLGDGVLAFFGAPLTHEDDPVRAVRAALDIQNGMEEYRRSLAGYVENLQMRVGLNTGMVVTGNVGSDLHMEYLAVGDSVNLAARLQSAAEPGKVLISEHTARLIGAAFELNALGEIEVKGKSEPIAVYEVVQAKAVRERGRGVAGLSSPLVGREKEMEVLKEALTGLLEGHGQIISIIGEAGIGKSRLVEEARAASAVRWLEGRSLSYGQSLSHWSITQIIRADLGLTDGDPEPKVRAHLKRRVTALFEGRSNQVLPYLTHLLGIRLEGEAAERVHALDGETLKRQTIVSVSDYIGGLARERPTVLVFEDLHWADPSTLDSLGALLPLTDRIPLMLLLVFRAERDHGSWRLKLQAETDFGHRYTEITLKPLSSGDSNRLVDNLLQVAKLPDKIRRLILARSEGNPFYLEEIIRSLIEQGAITHDGRGWHATTEMANVAIPETLQEVLLARIDRLQEDVRRTLQLASVIGRSFLYRLLQAIAEAEKELDQHLAQLQRVDLVREKARRPELEYIFKHSLTQEAAYSSLLVERRKEFHRKVGVALEDLFTDRKEEFYGLLAHHFDMGGEREKAVHYLILAGDKARLEDAHEEAIDYYRRAVGLLVEMGDEERAARTWLKLGLVYHGNFQFQAAHEANEAAFALQRKAQRGVRPATDAAEARGIGEGFRPRVLRFSMRLTAATADPAHSYYPTDGLICSSIFAGLAVTDVEMNVLPHVARSWEVLEGGTRYLIHLREDVKWADGTSVTAGDFEWAWKRNLAPATASETAPLLDEVVGAREYREGRASNPDLIGVRALDVSTLEVRLTSPVAYFPYLFTLPITFPLHRASLDRYGAKWWEPEHIVSNGAFRLVRLDPAEGFVLERNWQYFGEFPGNVERVEGSFTPDDPSDVRMFQEGSLDLCWWVSRWNPLADLAAVPAEEQFEFRMIRTAHLILSPNHPPLDDLRVRRALIQALDRKRMCENVLGPDALPARGGLVPQGLPGHSPELGPGYDLEEARRLIAEAGYPNAKGFPHLLGDAGVVFAKFSEEVARQWREGLGVEIDFRLFGPGAEPDQVDHHVIAFGWLADYPDPDSFLRNSVVYSILRQSGWRDARYEGLVEEAARTSDRPRRMAMYREADRLWVEEQSLVLPLFYGGEWISLVKPWVKGYSVLPLISVDLRGIKIEK
jgi:ABC-type oligopeptide transport system substrate-binding subunit/class 3 adenylate cyclase